PSCPTRRSSDLTLSSASLCVPLPLLLSPRRHTLSMASLCVPLPLSHSPLLLLHSSDRQVTSDPPGEAALWVKHTEFGFSLCPSLTHSPTLLFSPLLSSSPLLLSSPLLSSPLP